MSENLTNFEDYVLHSPAFDEACARNARAHCLSDLDYSDYSDPWEKNSSSSSPYDVSELEANRYYYGLRGYRRRGPKLIFRTSKDVITAPTGAEWEEPRFMRLLPVYEHHTLGKDDLWATIRSKIVELLDQRDIQHSSVDLVRFSWFEENDENKNDEDDEENEENGDDEEEDDNDGDFKVAPYGKTVVITPVTIWVGVLPDTLTGEVAFHSSNDILDLLKEHGISDVDVAYRESVVRSFSGPELFAPVSEFDPLKAVIGPVTTALGLPIAGLNMLETEGTMGFYFRVGKDRYAVTARHVLFPEDEGNNPYSYVAGPKKEVVLMGTKTFTNFIVSIQRHINDMNITVKYLERVTASLTAKSEGGGPNAEQAEELVETQCKLSKARTAIEELKKFFLKMRKQWAKPKDRVIGHVVWAPSVSTTPHSYTKDICVVKLDEEKFSQNFKGNVLDFGPVTDLVKFIRLMRPRINTLSDFNYTADGLVELKGILSAEEIRAFNNKDHGRGVSGQYVIKRGLTTLVTVGCLNGFESHVRRYFALGTRNSVEAAVYPYYNDSGPFSKRGDSGSIIVDAQGKFVALLTSGTGSTDISDITFGSPMYWLWEIIEAKFPGASLSFEGCDN
ncbi:hypothetical protein F5887DRAFT_1134608 [Amanita rubescens]|nr:hypothetical protein F5887DRAFT_1134608 [Amanita rubescens]